MKHLKISEELVSEVLGKEVTKCSLINMSRNSINITYFEDKEDFNPICIEWNIYEFSFKCKEWAYTKGYILSSNNYYKGGCCQVIQENGEECTECGECTAIIFIHSFTEIEAIFKACEWIQENIK